MWCLGRKERKKGKRQQFRSRMAEDEVDEPGDVEHMLFLSDVHLMTPFKPAESDGSSQPCCASV
jgi:hypothetical protein